MAITSLRAYNREIESLIERGQYEQAIFHCRHILQYFPKHIDTYRLLGKTYLESQRYGDAADILQRVLSSIPDDFVSHVGLSIIREDEGNLSDAIWHMERAFESQPSNSAIQAELRRLRNKRDGYDAPKVRLTRGALARMYMKGDLHPQAIAELRAALVEDPKRIDLQILLGQCYLRVDQRVEAAETCSIILHKLPYALEANRILEQILSSTERSDEARACRERVQALDPYYAHTTSVRPDSSQVPDEAVVIEKATWQPGRSSGQLGAQPDWAASLGVKVDDLAPTRQDVPEWLSGAAPQAETSAAEDEEVIPEAAQAPQGSDDFIPEWLKDAGWGPSSGESESIEAADDVVPGPDVQPAVGAEIPDWLKAIAPEAEAGEPVPLEDTAGEQDDLAWLEQPEPGLSAGMADLPADSIQPEAELDLGDVQEPIEVPDWLMELGGAQAEQPSQPAEVEKSGSEDMPDWLAELAPEDQVGQEPTGQEPAAELFADSSAQPAALPDWLKEIEPEAGAETEASAIKPDTASKDEEWLFEFEDKTPASPSFEESLPADAADFPEWLKNISAEGTAGQPGLELSSESDDEALSELAALPSDELPDWMKEIEAEYVQAESAKAGEVMESSPETPEEIPSETPVPSQESEQGVVPFSADDSDVDSAFAWLESLAAKQGAREDELLLSPDQRQEAPPDWIADSETPQEAQPEIFQAQAASPGLTAHLEFPDEEGEETGAEPLPDWLKEIQTEPADEIAPAVEESTLPKVTPAFTEADIEAELAGLSDEGAGISEQKAEAEPVVFPDWLSELEEEVAPGLPDYLEQKEGLAEEALITPESEAAPGSGTEPEAEAEAEAAELPDWLRELEAEVEPQEPASVEPEQAPTISQLEVEAGEGEAAPVIEPEAEAEPAELPDWLRELEAEVEPQEPASLEPAEAALEEGFDFLDTEAELEGEQEAIRADLPDWLQAEAAEAAPQSELHAWPEEPDIIEGDTRPSTGILKHLQPEVPQPASEELAMPSEALVEPEAAELPDWLVEMAGEPPLDEIPAQNAEAAFNIEEPEDIVVDLVQEETEDLPEWPVVEPSIIEAEESEDIVEGLVQEEAAFLPEWPEVAPSIIEAEEPEDIVEGLVQEEAAFLPEWPKAEPSIVDVVETGEEPEAIGASAEAEIVSQAIVPEAEVEAEEFEALTEISQEQTPAEFADEDAAFAWLESLATRQGAREDELLLEPDERTELPPDWIKKVLDTGELTPAEPLEPGLPAFIEARTGPMSEYIQEPDLPVQEQPAIDEVQPGLAEEVEPALGEPAAEALPELDQVREGLPIVEGEEFVEGEIETGYTLPEQVSEPVAPVEEITETVPALPDWLQDLEEQPVQEEEITWTPPEAAITPEQVELESVDLNTASLRDLERLPGVGFIRAQALIAYREANGPFHSVEELNLIDGFDADTIQGLLDVVQVEAPAPAVEEAPLPVSTITSEEAQVTLLQARNELVQDLTQPAMQKYLSLIESEELLEDVIHDLHEAISRSPKDFDTWQALGDANLRAGHIQEALNAYTRAEELLR